MISLRYSQNIGITFSVYKTEKEKCINYEPFTSAKIPINYCVIETNKLRKYYNVMRDFCVLFRHKKELYVVVYCRRFFVFIAHFRFRRGLSEKSLNLVLFSAALPLVFYANVGLSYDSNQQWKKYIFWLTYSDGWNFKSTREQTENEKM